MEKNELKRELKKLAIDGEAELLTSTTSSRNSRRISSKYGGFSPEDQTTKSLAPLKLNQVDISTMSSPRSRKNNVTAPQTLVETPKKSSSSGKTRENENSTSDDQNNIIFQVKWIGWRSNRVPIITQNSNGPCPMLAIANILLLRGKMELQDGCEMVSSEQLIERLGMYA